MLTDWIFLILRTSLLLSLSSCGVLLLIRWKPLMNPHWHRMAWAFVLLQGLLLFPGWYPVNLPEWIVSNAVASLPPLTPHGTSMKVDTSLAWQDEPHKVDRSATSSRSLAKDGTVQHPHRESQNGDSVRQQMLSETLGGNAMYPQAPANGTDLDVRREPRELAARLQTEDGTSQSSLKTAIASDGSDRIGQTESLLNWSGAAVLPWIWLSGVTCMLFVLVGNYLMLMWALRRSRRARPVWDHEMQDLCMELGLNHAVRLRVHSTLGPFLCRTPRSSLVVVPVQLWNRLSPSERIAVLHHELCHLRRGDIWKSLVARLVVALHWFNPLAWLSARKFEESAEWACDAMVAHEKPRRVTQLANALLTAVRGPDVASYGALAATGGPVFQRIRRLLTWQSEGDTYMQKFQWASLLAGVTLLTTLRWQATAEAQSETLNPDNSAEVIIVQDGEAPNVTEQVAATDNEDGSKLEDLASRIITKDNADLAKFVSLLRSPTGRIVMADRAAIQAQEVVSNEDSGSLWEQFVASHFEQKGDTWSIKSDATNDLAEFARACEVGKSELPQVAAVVKEVATALAESSDQAAVLKRFLEHEAAPAYVYHSELQSRLHPGVENIGEALGESVIRTKTGYVVRPARRSQVTRRLAFVERIKPVLGHFHKELAVWSDELADIDAVHHQFKAALANPQFAEFLLLSNVGEETRNPEEDLEGVFWQLEEATDDTAAGLKLNPETDQFKELQANISRFSSIWEHQANLREPLNQLVAQIETKDELHRQLKEFLATDMAVVSLAVEMDYLPVSPEDATREWIAYWVTKNEAGKYEITIESPDELSNQLREFFEQFRELRRRGRAIDEFAAHLDSPTASTALQSFLGKLLLRELMEQSAVKPDVDGLQLWVDAHFEETTEGLVLNDGAGEVIQGMLQEAVELEAELSKADF